MIHFDIFARSTISTVILEFFKYTLPLYFRQCIFDFIDLCSSFPNMHTGSQNPFIGFGVFLSSIFMSISIVFIIPPSVFVIAVTTSSGSIFGTNLLITVNTILVRFLLIIGSFITRATHSVYEILSMRIKRSTLNTRARIAAFWDFVSRGSHSTIASMAHFSNKTTIRRLHRITDNTGTGVFSSWHRFVGTNPVHYNTGGI